MKEYATWSYPLISTENILKINYSTVRVMSELASINLMWRHHRVCVLELSPQSITGVPHLCDELKSNFYVNFWT